MNKIFIVDDDRSILHSLQNILTKEGYEIQTFDRPEAFLEQLKIDEPAVAVLDIFYGDCPYDGEDLIKVISEGYLNTQCIVISGETDIQKTLSCLKQGALDFLEKPISLPRLITSVRNAVTIYNSKKSSQAQHKILYKSQVMHQIFSKIKKLATLNESVLITGESGTGKELIAENLHLFSRRYTLPMYKLNCTALNANLIESALFGHKKGSFTGADKDKKGYFESANSSTLFIDEIGDFPLDLQSKILRVLQEQKISPVGSTKEVEIDTRLIFATHRNLQQMIQEGIFREDLYFRICTFTINLPPLRNRLEDIDVLAPHFLEKFLMENNLGWKTFSPDAMVKLKGYHYPGNIRELAKIIKNAAFFSEGDVILPQDIELTLATQADIWMKTRTMTLSESKHYFEKELVRRRLRIFGNDMERTAESFGIIKNNLYRKLKDLGIDKDEFQH